MVRKPRYLAINGQLSQSLIGLGISPQQVCDDRERAMIVSMDDLNCKKAGSLRVPQAKHPVKTVVNGVEQLMQSKCRAHAGFAENRYVADVSSLEFGADHLWGPDETKRV